MTFKKRKINDYQFALVNASCLRRLVRIYIKKIFALCGTNRWSETMLGGPVANIAWSTWDQSVLSEKVRQKFHAKKKKNNKLSPLSRAFFPTPIYYANEPGWNNLFHIPSLCKWTIKEQESILDNERQIKIRTFQQHMIYT